MILTILEGNLVESLKQPTTRDIFWWLATLSLKQTSWRKGRRSAQGGLKDLGDNAVYYQLDLLHDYAFIF